MSTSSGLRNWHTPAEPGFAPADRFPPVRARKGLRIVARAAVIAVTLGLAGLSGTLVTRANASNAGQVATQSPDAAPADRVAVR